MIPYPWSYSALKTFTTCPAQYHAVKVLKTAADVKGEEARYGDYVHKQFELYHWEGKPLPSDLAHHTQVLIDLAFRPGVKLLEAKLAVNRQLQPCKFFAKDVWARGIVDFAAINGSSAYIVDYKTGKRTPNTDQLELCALLIFAAYPQVQQCNAEYYMTQTQQFVPKIPRVIPRSHIPALWKKFIPDLKQYAEAFKTDIWQERPSGLCRGWCPVKQCAHWTPKQER